MKQEFLPESMYDVDLDMTYEKISYFHENNLSLTGFVKEISTKKRILEVNLGGGLTGILPFTLSTIYTLYQPNGYLSPNVHSLYRKKIRFKIFHIDSNNIILSRKASMLEALESLKKESFIQYASITGFSRTSAFLDIGAGIIGKSYGKEFCRNLFSNAKDVGLKLGNIISVKILSYIESEKHFELSRVAALPPVQSILRKNSQVTCKVFGPVNDKEGIGYFVGIFNNSFCGIVDSPYVTLHYGDEISAIVKKITPKGVKLLFVKKISWFNHKERTQKLLCSFYFI